MTEEKMRFEAEVSRLLDIVVHSLYSNKDIFLRERPLFSPLFQASVGLFRYWQKRRHLNGVLL